MDDISIDSRIMKRTGLNRYEVKFYKLFCDAASQDHGLIIPDSVKDDLAELIEGEYDSEISSWDDSIEEEYDKWLELFKTKGLLIEPCQDNFGGMITLLHGYTPYEDPEIYVSYREKGTEKWVHRTLRSNFLTHKDLFIKKGYEFKLD